MDVCCPGFVQKGFQMLTKRDFTDRFLKSIKPAPPGKRLIIYDAQVPGFGVRVTDKGAISFVLVDRYPGSPHPTARLIDRYPAVSLAKAREVARAWKEDLRHGVDPKAKEAHRQRAEERRRATTFGVVFALFTDDHLSTLRSGHAVKAAVERHVIPTWGDRPISGIQRIDVRELMLALRKIAPVQTKGFTNAALGCKRQSLGPVRHDCDNLDEFFDRTEAFWNFSENFIV
jgi:Arm DNA-binding domain